MDISFEDITEIAKAFGIEATTGSDGLGEHWTFTFRGPDTRTRIIRLRTKNQIIHDINGDNLQLAGDWAIAIAWALTGSRHFMTTYFGLKLCDTIRNYLITEHHAAHTR